MFAHRRRWIVLPIVGLVGLATACVQLAPPSLPAPAGQVGTPDQDSSTLAAGTVVDIGVQQTPAAVPAQPTPGAAGQVTSTGARTRATPTARIPQRRLVAVRTGPISNVAQLAGQVVANMEAPLAFSQGGKIDTVAVQPGQTVQANQLLASIDSTDAARALSDAQAEAQIDSLKLQQLQARLTAQSQSQQRQQAQDQQRQQLATQAADKRVADATAAAQELMRQAQANLQRVQAGASATDRLTVQVAVVTAQGAYDKARSDLARLQAGPSQADLLPAQREVTTATIGVGKAEAERAKLTAPPEPAAVASAREALAGAQANLDAANSPAATPDGRKISDSERQHRRDAAQQAVTAAKAQLDALLKGPDKLAIDLANAAVDSANMQLATAQAHLDQTRAGPTRDQLDAANNAVQVAQIALSAAQARATEVNSHPTDAELDDAQTRVAQAQAALDQAPLAAQLPDTTTPAQGAAAAPGAGAQQNDDPTVERLQLQHALDQHRASIASLQAQIAASQLRAPFAGLVESIQVRAGDTVQAQQQIAIIATADEPFVSLQLPVSTNPGPNVGDPVQVQFNGNNFVGQIASLSDGTKADTRVAQLHVDWNGAHPAPGSTTQISITMQHKDNALIVPPKAIRTTSGKKTVQVLDNDQPKTLDVTVGITSADSVEILSGLAEGQTVILPN